MRRSRKRSKPTPDAISALFAVAAGFGQVADRAPKFLGLDVQFLARREQVAHDAVLHGTQKRAQEWAAYLEVQPTADPWIMRLPLAAGRWLLAAGSSPAGLSLLSLFFLFLSLF